MRIWMPSAPTWRATIRLRAAERLRAADRLIQVWSLQQRVVPGAGAHMSPRLDAPTGRCLDIDVFISAIARYAGRALHAEHDQVDSAGCSIGRELVDEDAVGGVKIGVVIANVGAGITFLNCPERSARSDWPIAGSGCNRKP